MFYTQIFIYSLKYNFALFYWIGNLHALGYSSVDRIWMSLALDMDGFITIRESAIAAIGICDA